MIKSLKNENLEAIKKHHPDIFNLIKDFDSESPSLELKTENSRSGEFTLSALKKDKTRIYLHSKYNPSKESETIVASWDIKKTDSNILILGLGLGYLSLHLLKKLSPMQNLFIVEPSIEIFSSAIEHTDLLPILNRPNTKLLIGSNFINRLKNHFSETDFKSVFFTHQPSLNLFPDLAKAISLLENITLPKLKEELNYPKFKSGSPKALLFETGFFIEQELKNSFNLLNISHTPLPVQSDRKTGDSDFIRNLMNTLAEFKPDFIISINQWGFDLEGKLVEILTHYKIPFVCWYVDNPLPLLMRKNKNASEYGLYLLWDDYYIDQMKNIGFTNVEYLPYGADSTIFYPPPSPVSKKYPVSFVGNSMENIIQERLDEIKNESFLVEIFNKLAGDSSSLPSAYNETNNLIKKEIGNNIFSDKYLSSLEIAINSKWTQKRRVSALLAIEEFSPHIFGDGGWKKLLPPSFNFHHEVNYHKELPEIYHSTEINLNISNVQLEHSVNQRLFDVCASGSFLLTDNSLAVKQFLVQGESVETFENHDDLRKKVEYFLKYPDAREKIAKEGKRAILENHTYTHRLKKILTLLKKKFA